MFECVETTKKKSSVVVGVIVVAAVVVVAGLVLVGFYIRRRRRRSHESKDVEAQEQDLELPLLDLLTISTATDNFSASNKLGEGGFGAVFRVNFVSYKENISKTMIVVETI